MVSGSAGEVAEQLINIARLGIFSAVNFMLAGRHDFYEKARVFANDVIPAVRAAVG